MKDIPNYENKYAIDKKGNVWSYKHKKFLKPVENHGYYGVSLCHKAASKALSKAVLCVETNAVYPSAKEAKKALGLLHCHIEDCCNGKRNVAGGFHWRYALD